MSRIILRSEHHATRPHDNNHQYIHHNNYEHDQWPIRGNDGDQCGAAGRKQKIVNQP